MKQKTDLRVIKTDQALYQALLELMKDKTFEQIKISDICSKALVNRSTFYDHYEDKYDLLMSMIDNEKKSLYKELQKNNSEVNSKEYFMKMLEIIVEQIDQNYRLYYEIYLNNKNSIIIDIIMDVVNKDINMRIKNIEGAKESKIPSQLLTSFYVGATVGFGFEWLKNKDSYSKKEIIEFLDKLIPEKL